MRGLQAIYNEYEGYVEMMVMNGGTRVFTFEEWLEYQVGIGGLSEEESVWCYTADGYLREKDMGVDRE